MSRARVRAKLRIGVRGEERIGSNNRRWLEFLALFGSVASGGIGVV